MLIKPDRKTGKWPRTKPSGEDPCPFKRHWSILDRKRNWLWYAPVSAQIHSDRSSKKLPVSMHPSHCSRCSWLQPQVLATQYKSGLKQVTWFFTTGPQRHDIRQWLIKSVLMGDAFWTSLSKLTCSWCLLTCVRIILLWKGNVYSCAHLVSTSETTAWS